MLLNQRVFYCTVWVVLNTQCEWMISLPSFFPPPPPSRGDFCSCCCWGVRPFPFSSSSSSSCTERRESLKKSTLPPPSPSSSSFFLLALAQFLQLADELVDFLSVLRAGWFRAARRRSSSIPSGRFRMRSSISVLTVPMVEMLPVELLPVRGLLRADDPDLYDRALLSVRAVSFPAGRVSARFFDSRQTRAALEFLLGLVGDHGADDPTFMRTPFACRLLLVAPPRLGSLIPMAGAVAPLFALALGFEALVLEPAVLQLRSRTHGGAFFCPVQKRSPSARTGPQLTIRRGARGGGGGGGAVVAVRGCYE